MPVILVTEPDEESILKAEAINEGFPNFIGQWTWCSFRSESAMTSRESLPNLLQCVPLTLTHDALEEIRWYLEEFAQNDPFKRSRAAKTKASILSYGKRLASAINWKDLISPDEWEQHLLLKIVDLDEQRNHIFWEILEHPEVWDPVAPPAIQVVRISSTEKAVETEISLKSETEGSSEDCNILVVAARPDSDVDIPHRLVSRVLHDLIRKRADELSRPVSMEIVRPATWEAFRNHLGSHPPGYFNIVHFDMHGLNDADERTLLAFIKPIPGDPGNFQPDLVCSTEVAAVLSRHKVNQVVLNACRSAKGRKAEKNVALSIMRAGIRTCVAMSHSISASAVEVFVSALYDALLLKCIPLEAATSMARAALRIYPQRLSGFGEYVLVDDWVVPVVYSNDSSSSNLGYSFPLERSIPRLSYVNQPPFGREGDILRIESSLFITKRPVLLVGQAGMGKTYLLQHLCDWWRDTGLIVGSHYVQFSTDRIWDLHELFNNLQEKLVDSNTSTKRDGVLSHLRSNTFLLVFDSLESIDFSDRLARRRLHRELSGLLKSLHGGKTLVIITSRAREDWLSQQTVTHYLGSIGNIAGMQYIRHSLDSARAENGDPKFETLEDYQHLEQLVKLVNGNPLALNLLLQHYQQSWKRPASYLVDLLAGKPIAFSKKDFGSQESFRSLGELEIIVDSLAPQGWQNWLPGQILAPFWKILPERDLRLYVMCYTRKTSQHSGNPFGFSSNGLGTTARNWVAKMNELCDLTGESIDSLGIPAFDIFKAIAEIPAEEEAKNPNALPDLVSLDDMILADEKYDLDDIVNTPIFDPLEEQCTRILEPLKNSLFLTKADAPLVPRHLRSRDYLLVHPILPMVLRAHPGYRQNVFGFGGSARLGFTMYYTYRSMKWPWNYQYFDPIWAEYRKEIGFEFINFLSAAACFLCSDRKVTDVRVEHAFLVRMLLVVHRGMSADLGHINVMQILYNKALDFSLEQESVLVARRRLQTTIGSSSQFPARPQGDGAESSVQDECLLLCQESILFLHRLNALHAAMFVGSSYSHLNSSKQSSFQKTSERLARDLIRDGVPSGFDATYWKKVLDYYLYISSVAMRPNWRADSKALAKRQEFIKLVTDRYGTQPSLENHGSLTDAIPIALLSTACHTARIATAVLSVRRALNENRLTDAQNILDRALKMEVFEACNDLANRATLLELRSEMHEKMGEWEDALGAFDEASRLRGQLSKQEESDEITMEMIERMSRRRRLERREPRDEVQKSSWAYFLASLVLKLLWWGLYQLLLWMWRTYRKSS